MNYLKIKKKSSFDSVAEFCVEENNDFLDFFKSKIYSYFSPLYILDRKPHSHI